MLNVLITGSEGLIARELKKQLNLSSIAFTCIDNKLARSSVNYGDIRHPAHLKDKINSCDGIVHLAAVSRVIWGEQKPKQCWETNAIATKTILELAKNAPKIPWVIYASSREVYGEQEILPVTEDAKRTGINVYGKSKIAAEDLVQQYHNNNKDINTAIVRFSNVYGDIYDHADRVVPAFCLNAVQAKNLYVEGEDNIFDFTYVGDVVEGVIKIILAMQQKAELPPIHFTTGKPTSLIDLAKLACNLSYNRAKIVSKPSRSFDVTRFYGDASRAKNLLGWVPKTSLEVGLKKLITSYQKHFSTINIS